jgi:hypothetical protein
MADIPAADRIPTVPDTLQNAVVHLERKAAAGRGGRGHGEQAESGQAQQGDSAGHERTSFGKR